MKRNLSLAFSLLALASCGEAPAAPKAEEAYVPEEPSITLPVVGKVAVQRCRVDVAQGDGGVILVASVPPGWICPAITLTFDRSPDGANVEGRVNWTHIDERDGLQWAATAEGSTLRLEPPTSRFALSGGTWAAKVALLRRGDDTPRLLDASHEEQRAGN